MLSATPAAFPVMVKGMALPNAYLRCNRPGHLAPLNTLRRATGALLQPLSAEYPNQCPTYRAIHETVVPSLWVPAAPECMTICTCPVETISHSGRILKPSPALKRITLIVV